MNRRLFALSLFLATSLMFLVMLDTPLALAQTSADSWNVEVVAQTGGRLSGIAVQGDLAFLGVGPSLHILDISDLTNPLLIGQSAAMSSLVQEVVVSESRAYVLTYIGLHIFDISEPSNPIELSSYVSFLNATDLAIYEDIAYVADAGGYFDSEDSRLNLIDVSEPQKPVLVGFDSRRSQRVAVSGDYAYVASGDILRILNVSDPASPTWVSYYDAPGATYEVTIDGNYVYTLGEGLAIFDVSNPFNPVVVGSVEAWAGQLSVSENYAYATSYNGLYVFDISDPTAPAEISFIETTGVPHDVFLTTNSAFVSEGRRLVREYEGGGFRILDTREPSQPQELSKYDPLQLTLWLDNLGGYVYLSGQDSAIRVLDTKDLSRPLQVTYTDTMSFATEIVSQGEYAYATVGWDRLDIIDISDPAVPKVVGSSTEPIVPQDVAVSGDYAYIADYGTYVNNKFVGGLHVLDVSNPVQPTKVAYVELPSHAFAIALSGNYVYVSCDIDWGDGDIPAGVHVFDISNPTMPEQVGFYPERTKDITIKDNYLYTIGFNLTIRDISDPTAPVVLGSHGLPGMAQSIAVDNSYAYIATQYAGLRILKIDNPSTPIEVFHYSISEYAFDVILIDGDIYAALGDYGLFALRFSPPNKFYLPLVNRR